MAFVPRNKTHIFPERMRDEYLGEVHFKVLATATTPGGASIEVPGDKCILYMPNSIQIADGVEYNNVDFGAIGALIEKGASGGRGPSMGTVKSFVDAMRDEANASFAGKMVANKVAGLAGAGAAAAVAGFTKVVPNPNTRAIFESVRLREFTFSFKLIPTSVMEAGIITDIIRYFRGELYPEALMQADNLSLGYKFPNRFNIEFLYNTKEIATKIKPCYLYSFLTNYNTTSMGMLQQGDSYSFSEVDITMNFRESKTLSRVDILVGGF